MAWFYIFSNPVTDEWGLGRAVYQGHKLILVIFGKIFIFNLQENKTIFTFLLLFGQNQM